jgi:hypothetical protein
MDEGRPPYRMSAPGAGSSRSYGLPGRGGFPRVDDYRTDIDFETEEMIGGVVYKVMSADLPHAQRNGQLDYLLQGVATPGYTVATDLKTRHDVDDDFATDSALVKEGTDPESGTRYLEEIAFEVVDQQSPSIVTRKAPRMIRRGVRRVFAVFVKKGRVKEWSTETGSWVTLHPTALIEDPILAEPIKVSAVLDAAEADDTVARGLVKKRNPEILRILQQRHEEGKAEGRLAAQRQAILSVLEARDLAVSPAVRDAVLASSDGAVLERWLKAAAGVDDADALLRI